MNIDMVGGISEELAEFRISKGTLQFTRQYPPLVNYSVFVILGKDGTHSHSTRAI